MSKVIMQRNLVGVVDLGKTAKRKQDASIFVELEAVQNCGIIRYLGPEVSPNLRIGQRVYVGNVRELIQMAGEEVMVMKEENVIAVVEVPHAEEPEKKGT